MHFAVKIQSKVFYTSYESSPKFDLIIDYSEDILSKNYLPSTINYKKINAKYVL